MAVPAHHQRPFLFLCLHHHRHDVKGSPFELTASFLRSFTARLQLLKVQRVTGIVKWGEIERLEKEMKAKTGWTKAGDFLSGPKVGAAVGTAVAVGALAITTAAAISTFGASLFISGAVLFAIAAIKAKGAADKAGKPENVPEKLFLQYMMRGISSIIMMRFDWLEVHVEGGILELVREVIAVVAPTAGRTVPLQPTDAVPNPAAETPDVEALVGRFNNLVSWGVAGAVAKFWMRKDEADLQAKLGGANLTKVANALGKLMLVSDYKLLAQFDIQLVFPAWPDGYNVFDGKLADEFVKAEAAYTARMLKWKSLNAERDRHEEMLAKLVVNVSGRDANIATIDTELQRIARVEAEKKALLANQQTSRQDKAALRVDLRLLARRKQWQLAEKKRETRLKTQTEAEVRKTQKKVAKKSKQATKDQAKLANSGSGLERMRYVVTLMGIVNSLMGNFPPLTDDAVNLQEAEQKGDLAVATAEVFLTALVKEVTPANGNPDLSQFTFNALAKRVANWDLERHVFKPANVAWQNMVADDETGAPLFTMADGYSSDEAAYGEWEEEEDSDEEWDEGEDVDDEPDPRLRRAKQTRRQLLGERRQLRRQILRLRHYVGKARAVCAG